MGRKTDQHNVTPSSPQQMSKTETPRKIWKPTGSSRNCSWEDQFHLPLSGRLVNVISHNQSSEEKREKFSFTELADFCGVKTPMADDFRLPTWCQQSWETPQRFSMGSHEPGQVGSASAGWESPQLVSRLETVSRDQGLCSGFDKNTFCPELH